MQIALVPLLLTVASSILVRQPAQSLATNDEILAEIKHRVELCEASGSPLAPLSLDALLAELKLREAEKICEPASPAPPETTRSPAPAPPLETTTTTTTTPCPDNFMDEIVDQANPDFEMWDADKDGCLTEREMTETLRRQRDVARERDYYWVQKNITAAARHLEQQWRAHHHGADANGGGCLNKEELEIIRHAVCDCDTQFLFVDHNADGRISQQEAANYVAEHVKHADLNHVKLRAIWRAADVDRDSFLSLGEFCEAGPRYGDGNKDAGTGDDNAGTEDPLLAIAKMPEAEDPDPLPGDA